MAQVDYGAIRRANKEHSERPKTFGELKDGDVVFGVSVDTLQCTTYIVDTVRVTHGEEEDMSWLETSRGEKKVYPYSNVNIILKVYGQDGTTSVRGCYGTQTFTMRDAQVFVTTERECKMVVSILRQKCECQVEHINAMFNGALETKQYRDPRNLIIH